MFCRFFDGIARVFLKTSIPWRTQSSCSGAASGRCSSIHRDRPLCKSTSSSNSSKFTYPPPLVHLGYCLLSSHFSQLTLPCFKLAYQLLRTVLCCLALVGSASE